jgi:NIMA (never in mitosis gene a)-related kinase
VVAAGDLQAALRRQRGDAVPEERCLDWLIQLALALKHIHDRRILHRCLVLPVGGSHQLHLPSSPLPCCMRSACSVQLQRGSRLACSQVLVKTIDARDFKTANIFMAEGGALKVGDFGVSTVLASTLALARTAIGTPYYISPEICLSRPYNAKVLRTRLYQLHAQCIVNLLPAAPFTCKPL